MESQKPKTYEAYHLLCDWLMAIYECYETPSTCSKLVKKHYKRIDRWRRGLYAQLFPIQCN